MKKVINGRVYDTETARELGDYANTYDYRNFRYVHETLYQKRTGEYFLHGEGGLLTQYAHVVDTNARMAGEGIIPLTPVLARAWAKEHFTADEYEEIFGLPGKNASSEPLHVKLPAHIMARLRQAAAAQSKSITAMISQILSDHLCR